MDRCGLVAEPPFRYFDAPGHPGWMTWELADSTRFNSLFGPFLLKVEGATARVRMTPGHTHSNLSGKVHGGALMAFVDMAIFAAARGFGLIEAGTAVTLDFSAQFIGRAEIDAAVEARVELLRETGRLLFLRGLVVQPGAAEGDAPVLGFTATIRKPSAR